MKRRRNSVKIPDSHTYDKPFQWCRQKSLSLHLDKPPYDQPVLTRTEVAGMRVTRSLTWCDFHKPKAVSFCVDRNHVISTAPNAARRHTTFVATNGVSRSAVAMTSHNAWEVSESAAESQTVDLSLERHAASKSLENLYFTRKESNSESQCVTLPDVATPTGMSKTRITDSDMVCTTMDNEKDSLKANSLSSGERDGSGTARHRKRLSSQELCELLKNKGLGDPKKNAQCVGSELTVSRERTLPNIPMRTREGVHSFNPSNLVKLRGMARHDYDLASSKANAFCEMQRNVQMRSASANWRKSRQQVPHFADDDSNNDVDDEDGHEKTQTNEEFFSRIKTWIYDVETASKDAQTKLEAINERSSV